MTPMETLDEQTSQLKRSVEELRGSVASMAQTTDDCVREYPWTSVGLAAAFGLCLGMLVSGSRSK